jgi:hypothetical protein
MRRRLSLLDLFPLLGNRDLHLLYLNAQNLILLPAFKVLNHTVRAAAGAAATGATGA